MEGYGLLPTLVRIDLGDSEYVLVGISTLKSVRFGMLCLLSLLLNHFRHIMTVKIIKSRDELGSPALDNLYCSP